ncbi:hypothetical protein ACN20G_31275 (plasmid) [Streptomyces sp. BI20]|uniref:hypothetical protein n=1 Tax=Streptomyces sp. BI20 TaxID=3403460 RepID=UPI003C7186C9
MTTTRSTARGTTGYLVTIGVTAGLAFFLDFLTFYLSIFATDSCGTGADEHFVCDNLLVVWALPWAGWVLGFGGALWLGLRAARRGRAPWWWLGPGILVQLALLALAWLLLTS